LVCWYPNFLGHSDNYILANPLVTPAHIVPEWYFLPFYAILRSITDKLQGVILMLFSIFVLILFPFILNSRVEQNFVPSSGVFRPFYQILIKILVCSFIILGWIGGNPAITPYIEIGFISMLIYFFCLTYGIYFVLIFECFYLNRNLFSVLVAKEAHHIDVWRESFVRFWKKGGAYSLEFEQDQQKIYYLAPRNNC